MEKIKESIRERIKAFGVKLEEFTDIVVQDQNTLKKKIDELFKTKNLIHSDLLKIKEIDS